MTSQELVFPRTEIPTEATNYFCHYIPLNVEAGKTYHMIASEPLIDNEEVMHHTLVYGCRDEESKNVHANISIGYTYNPYLYFCYNYSSYTVGLYVY